MERLNGPEGLSGDPAAPTSTTPGTGLEGLLAGLQAKLDELSKTLANSESTVKNVSQQSGLVQSDLRVTKKVAGDYAGAQDEAGKAIQEAEKARENAKAIVDTLGQDDVNRLDAKIGSINQDYQARGEALAAAQQALADHQKAGKDLEVDVVRKKEAFDGVCAEASRLPADVKAHVASLKALARDLGAAADAGQALKAYVRRSELDAVITMLQELTSDGHMDELASSYVTGLDNLSKARAVLGENIDKLAQMKAAVTTAQADVEKATVKRKEEMDKLYVLQKSTATPA